MSFIHAIFKVVTFYHQILISKWATQEAVGLLHFARLVARLATFHDLLNLTPAVTSYLQFCEETIIQTKTVTTFPNNKPRITKELKLLLNEKKMAFMNGYVSSVRKLLSNNAIDACKRTIKFLNLESIRFGFHPEGICFYVHFLHVGVCNIFFWK